MITFLHQADASPEKFGVASVKYGDSYALGMITIYFAYCKFLVNLC